MKRHQLFHAGLAVLGITLFLNSALIAQDTASLADNHQHFAAKKWFHQADIAFIAGNKDISEGTSLSLALVNGLRLSDHLAAGIGAGWDRYDRQDIFPVFARIMAMLKPSGHTPYLMADGGYAWAHYRSVPEFTELNTSDGGIMLQGGAGYMFAGNTWRINLFAAYRIQKSTVEFIYPDPWGAGDSIISEERTRKRFVSGISFLF